MSDFGDHRFSQCRGVEFQTFLLTCVVIQLRCGTIEQVRGARGLS